MPREVIIIIAVVVFFVAIIIFASVISIFRKITRGIRSTKRNIMKISNAVSDIGDIAEIISDGARVTKTVTRVTKVSKQYNGNVPKEIIDAFEQGFEPQKKTVGGATNVYLPIIQKDFPEYHNSNAESDIKSVMRDYIRCIHSGKTTFESKSINANVVSNIIPKENGKVTNLVFHQIAIYNYQKTLDYATVVYRISFGYKLNDTPIETRYEIHYTLQLREQGVASKSLRCTNCNAPLDEITHMTVCPYCEAKIVRDTILNWVVSDIRELD